MSRPGPSGTRRRSAVVMRTLCVVSGESPMKGAGRRLVEGRRQSRSALSPDSSHLTRGSDRSPWTSIVSVTGCGSSPPPDCRWLQPYDPPLLAATLAVVAVAAGWRGVDWPAQMYPVQLVRTHGLISFDVSWYGEALPLAYSVPFPALAAAAGLGVVAVVSAATATRASPPRPGNLRRGGHRRLRDPDRRRRRDDPARNLRRRPHRRGMAASLRTAVLIPRSWR